MELNQQQSNGRTRTERLDADPSAISAGEALRESANDDELSEADLAAIDAEFGITPDSIDNAMLLDKQRNRYDTHREEVARAESIACGEPWRRG